MTLSRKMGGFLGLNSRHTSSYFLISFYQRPKVKNAIEIFTGYIFFIYNNKVVSSSHIKYEVFKITTSFVLSADLANPENLHILCLIEKSQVYYYI